MSAPFPWASGLLAGRLVTGEGVHVAGGQQIQGPNQALLAGSFHERGTGRPDADAEG